MISIWETLKSQNVSVGRGLVSSSYRQELKLEKLHDLPVVAVPEVEPRTPDCQINALALSSPAAQTLIILVQRVSWTNQPGIFPCPLYSAPENRLPVLQFFCHI